jgi:drug/metabolite transporter (DMT)-like permease
LATIFPLPTNHQNPSVNSVVFLTHRRAVLVMLVVTFLWSIAGVVTRHLESAHSFEVTFWRSFFTAISLLIILPFFQGRSVFIKIRRSGVSLWLSGACWAVMFTAFMLALTMTTVANVLVTLAISPLATALIATIFIGHRLAARTWLAIVLAGAGIGWMFGGQMALGKDMSGTLVALFVPLASAANWTLVQHSRGHGEKIDMVPAVLLGAVISCLFTLPLSLPFSATMHDVGLLAMLGLVQLAIPCVLAVMCAGVLKAPEVALLGLLEVIFGILLAWLGAGEVPGPNVLAGGTLVISALLINELIRWRQKL